MQLSNGSYRVYSNPNYGLHTLWIKVGSLKIYYALGLPVAYIFKNNGPVFNSRIPNRAFRLIKQELQITGYTPTTRYLTFMENLERCFKLAIIDLSKEAVQSLHNIRVAA